MPTESVWVEPLPVESANAESLEDLKRLYLSKRQLIQQRLDELRTGWSKTDEGVFAELCYCILIANRRADIVIKLVTEMEKSDLLLRGSEDEMSNYLMKNGYGLADDRSKSIVLCRAQFSDQGSVKVKQPLERLFKLDAGWEIQAMREYLVTQTRGVGWKVASHFLRNTGIGLDHGLALLDRHIQRELAKFGYTADVIDHNLSKTRYLDYEAKLQKLSIDAQIPVDDLDLLIWSNRTGVIIK